jgi:hypothetical protein
LARWGRRDTLVKAFEAEITRFLADDGSVSTLIEKHLPRFVDLLIRHLIAELLAKFVDPRFREWRDGEIETISNLSDKIKADWKNWLHENAGKAFVASTSNEWWAEMAGEIRELLDPICRQYDIPLGSLDVHFPFTPESFSELELEFPVPLEGFLRIIGYVIFWAVVWALPIGGPIIAALITLIFKDEIDSFIDSQMRDISIYRWMRQTISADSILEAKDEQGEKMAEVMRRKILGDESTVEALHMQLLDQLRLAFRKRAQEAAFLIR